MFTAAASFIVLFVLSGAGQSEVDKDKFDFTTSPKQEIGSVIKFYASVKLVEEVGGSDDNGAFSENGWESSRVSTTPPSGYSLSA